MVADSLNPFITVVPALDYHPKFQFKGIIKQISYERRAYELVDDESIS